jgi:addiction module RelE/StbE family toxin
MNDCGAKSKLFRPLIYLSKTGNYSSLRNHPLKDKFAGVRSIDVTADWRALYRRERERIIFVEFGTHDQLYGENS